MFHNILVLYTNMTKIFNRRSLRSSLEYILEMLINIVQKNKFIAITIGHFGYIGEYD